MPKFIGAPKLARRRTYLNGKFRGKFDGDMDLQHSDLSRENFYDLKFLDGEITAKETDIMQWRDGESKKFLKIRPFPTPLFNQLKCNIKQSDGSLKHFAINLCEPKIRKPKLINQVYEGSRLFTTIDGEISGYITHVELEGTVIQIPEPEPEKVRASDSSKKTPWTPSLSWSESRDAEPKEHRNSDSFNKPSWTSFGQGAEYGDEPSRFGRPAGGNGLGCLDISAKGCFTGFAAFFAVLLGLAFLSAIASFLLGLWRTHSVPLPPAPVNTNRIVNQPPPVTPSQSSNTNVVHDSDVGKTGRFTTNQNLRSGPSLSSSSVAIHFQNARFRILEQDSHQTSQGLSTWYKVQIMEYGCDSEEVLRCGKNSPTDLDVGWLNAKFVSPD